MKIDDLQIVNLLDLKNKITSTKNTGQITKALEMVAASRQKKAQDFLNNSRFLRNSLKDMIDRIATQLDENAKTSTSTIASHELPLFFHKSDSKKNLIVNVMSQRGLCGGLNANLFSKVVKLKREIESGGDQVEFISVNKSSQKYLRNFHEKIIAYFAEIKENPELEEILPIVDLVKENFSEYKNIYIAYSEFVKTGVYSPKIIKLLPIESDPAEPNEGVKTDFIIEPDPRTALETLSNMFIELEIYEAVLSNQASEHTARMISMKKATDNVKNLVKDLTLKLNKERQAKITQQVAEISSNL